MYRVSHAMLTGLVLRQSKRFVQLMYRFDYHNEKGTLSSAVTVA